MDSNNDSNDSNPSSSFDSKYDRRIDKLGVIIAITGAIACFSGFLIVRRPSEVSDLESIHEPPAKFALRALKYATLFTLTGTGILSVSFCYLFNVWSFKEFNSLMRDKISPISKRMDSVFPKVLRYQKGVLKNENVMQFRNKPEGCNESFEEKN